MSEGDRQAGPADTRRLLETLGLTSVEASVYSELLRGDASPKELSARAGLGVGATKELLEGLVRLGLAKRLPGRVTRFGLVSPELALPQLLRRREEALQASRAAIERLAAEHRSRTLEAEASYVEIVVGIDAIRSQFTSLQAEARTEILGCSKPPILVTPIEEGNPGEEDALARGVRNRWLYQSDLLETPGVLEGIERFVERGEESRVLPRLPSKMFIIDRELAFLHVTQSAPEGHQVVGIMLRHQELVSTLLGLFEMLWERATPLFAAAAVPDTEFDPKIIEALAAGITDEAIGRQLGISTRTVGRRVRELLERIEAASRFQAGYQLGRRAGR